MESSIRGMSFEEERGDREVNQNEAEGSATVADTAAGGGGTQKQHWEQQTRYSDLSYLNCKPKLFSWVSIWGE